jgi:hypothetical protein
MLAQAKPPGGQARSFRVWSSSIDVDARVTPLHPPGNPEAGATAQCDCVWAALWPERLVRALHVAVILEPATSARNNQRPLSRSAAPV